MTYTIELAMADRDSAFGSDTDDELVNIDIDASIAKLDQLTLESMLEIFTTDNVVLGERGLRIFPEDLKGADALYRVVADEAERIHGRGEWIVYR